MLNEYQKKRDFSRTTEPSPAKRKSSGRLAFVIQKHSAHRLHYDFRLEIGGVLKSWAVPKGPSLDPQNKRLAVMVEDHPLDYQSFEGVIPQGEYGAGQVIVWDRGEFVPEEENKSLIVKRPQAEAYLKNGLEKGKIAFILEGHKLKGSWALIKMQHTKNDWLLIKHQDEFAKADVDIQEEEKSVISGHTIEDLKKKPRNQIAAV